MATRFFHLVLLTAALFGVLGQGVALAMSPNCDAAMEQAAQAQSAKSMPMAGKMDCCPEARSDKKGFKPAKDIMPNCQMMAGCYVSLAMGSFSVVPVLIPIKGSTADRALVRRLAGRATPPVPPPPTI